MYNTGLGGGGGVSWKLDKRQKVGWCTEDPARQQHPEMDKQNNVCVCVND